MNVVKVTLVAALAALVAAGVSTTSYAFHSGGVAECEGCHSMHSPKAGGVNLLVGSDQSSTCLSCHEHAGDTGPSSYHISTADADLGAGVSPKQRTPGGDFGWLRKTYTDGSYSELGRTHGHNVVALDQGLTADDNNITAPGGTFLSSQLGCQSCHDPHSANRRLSDGTYVKGGVRGAATAPIIGSGSYNNSKVPAAGEAVGVYRLLRGLGDSSQGVTFATLPIAVAPSAYNQSEADNQVRVAYGASGTNTWGNWCATCHPDMHSSGNYVHPVDHSLDTEIAANYNAYVTSGDLTGTSATAFFSLVPFAENTGDITTLASHARNNNSVLNGPANSDQVMCLSCHRAHASGMAEMLRYDNGYEFMTVNGKYLGTDSGEQTSNRGNLQRRGRTMAEWQAAYYDRPVTTFATYQRVLCNKCHAKD
jgi:predicted CXXCH cytochrome family protein